MAEDIDLRPYITAIIHYWKWIIGTALLVAGIVFSATSLLPPTYQASTLIAIITSQQVVLTSLSTENVDPRLSLVNQGTPPFRAYPDIAMSDELLQSVLEQLNPPPKDITTLEGLRSHLEVESGTDLSVVYLHVRMTDPNEAARVANIWGELFVAWANTIYGTQDDTQLRFFEDQLEQTTAELEAAEQALIDFQAHNTAAILSNKLATLQQTQANYLSRQQAGTLLIQDLQALRDQVATHSNGNNVTFADQLTALSLQVKAFNAETALSLQLQTETDTPLTFGDPNEQIAFLESLIATLSTQSGEIDSHLAELEPQILALQQQKQEIETEGEQLTRVYNTARETYIALVRKVTEERLTTEDNGDGVKLASKASVPLNPTNNDRVFNTLVGGVFGFMLSMSAAFVITWWRAEHIDAQTEQDESMQSHSGSLISST